MKEWMNGQRILAPPEVEKHFRDMVIWKFRFNFSIEPQCSLTAVVLSSVRLVKVGSCLWAPMYIKIRDKIDHMYTPPFQEMRLQWSNHGHTALPLHKLWIFGENCEGEVAPCHRGRCLGSWWRRVSFLHSEGTTYWIRNGKRINASTVRIHPTHGKAKEL